MQRREFLGSVVATTAAVALAPRLARADVAAALPLITVYKSPLCGCCGEWVKHIEKAGFTTKVVAMEDLTDRKSTRLNSSH